MLLSVTINSIWLIPAVHSHLWHTLEFQHVCNLYIDIQLPHLTVTNILISHILWSEPNCRINNWECECTDITLKIRSLNRFNSLHTKPSGMGYHCNKLPVRFSADIDWGPFVTCKWQCHFHRQIGTLIYNQCKNNSIATMKRSSQYFAEHNIKDYYDVIDHFTIVNSFTFCGTGIVSKLIDVHCLL